MVALRRKARSTYRKFPSPETRAAFNLQAAKTKRFLRRAKQQSWLHFCSTLDSCTSNTKVWKMLRKMDGSPSFDFQYPIIDNGSFLEHSLDIANCFADNFSQHFNSTATVQNYYIKKLTIDSAIQLSYCTEYNTDFSLHELKQCLQNLNKKSSMGPDNIHNKFLTNLTPNFQNKLLEAINYSWSRGFFPSDLKISTLLPILKPGKVKNLTSSYRPLSVSAVNKLQSSISVINSWLKNHAFHLNSLNVKK